MPRKLDVYLHGHLVGKLVQDDHGTLSFDYVESWRNNPNATPLSQSLPLAQNHFNRKVCRGFFAGILPDESKREVIAKNLGISTKNDFAMLEQIGGECAGAVTFIPEGQVLPDRDHDYQLLTPGDLAEKLKALPRRPLLAGEKGIRLSLAGAQDKIAVHISGDKISIPLDGSPSTHILKPATERFEGLVFNEALCVNLARTIGLDTAKVSIRNVEGIDYLLVERYDRAPAKDGQLRREHQEDFCQSLGIVPECKYQAEGGPSIKQCFALIREASSTPVLDLQALLDAVIFNWLIGNNDAHGKNFSFVYCGEVSSGLQTRLAPLYDLVSTVYYQGLSPKMAMKIGGEYDSETIFPRNFERLAEEAGLAKPMVVRRVAELGASMLSALPNVGTDQAIMTAVAKTVQSRCEGLLKRFNKK
jgi:serine/threonine-protein kinase HipA